VLFNEPKLLKSNDDRVGACNEGPFSALQRAEIAEIYRAVDDRIVTHPFSALQRAEIAEIERRFRTKPCLIRLSVLFNEPKLLKFCKRDRTARRNRSFSALQRAEIAEITGGGKYYVWVR